MTQQQHTPEPWDVSGYYVQDEELFEIAIVKANWPEHEFIQMANARRIVACVNACAGLDTEYLEAVGLPEFAGKQLCADMVQQELDAVKAQRDKLQEIVNAQLKDMANGMAAMARISWQRDQLRSALEFYADKQRYMGPNQAIDKQDKYGESPANTVYLWDVTKDRGDIARAAMAATEDKQ